MDWYKSNIRLPHESVRYVLVCYVGVDDNLLGPEITLTHAVIASPELYPFWMYLPELPTNEKSVQQSQTV